MNREQKKKQMEKRIVEAAFDLFTKQGYEATTIAQITEQAGCAKGTFFNYFQSKEDLVCGIQMNATFDKAEHLMSISGPIVPMMKAYVQELALNMRLNRQLAGAVFQASLSSPKSFENHVNGLKDLNHALTPLFALGQQRGEIDDRMSPELLSQLAVQTYYGVLIHWGFYQGDDNVGIQMAITFELFFSGLTKTRSNHTNI